MKRLCTFIFSAFVFSNISAQTAGSAESSASETMTDAIYARAYPNPASSKLHFTISEKMTGSSIRVINVLGAEVLSYETMSAHDAIDISTLQSGVYIYRVMDRNDKILLTGKFNKE
jgi:Secretion system C-terminal sorting domain